MDPLGLDLVRHWAQSENHDPTVVMLICLVKVVVLDYNKFVVKF